MASVTPVSKYKVVFLGDQSVGKTSILTRYMCDKFDTAYNATIGIDFMSKSMYLKDRTIRVHLWDTSGQERFRSLTLSYIRDLSLAVIVYDVANRQSFLNITKWIEDVRRDQRGTDIIIVLVGNNVDHVDKRQVLTEEGDEKARELGAMFIETSAFAGFNIKTLFQTIASALLGMETLLSKKQEDMVEQKEDIDAGKHKDCMKEEDQRPPSSLTKLKTEEMQVVEGQCHCGRMGGQRCDEMLKLIVEMQEGKRRMEERIKQVEFMVERVRLDDIKRWEGMSKRLEEMQDNMFRRLDELNSRNDPLDTVGYKEIYEPLKILRLKEVEVDADDVVFVTKLYKRKRDDEIHKMEEDKITLNPLRNQI